jgi:glycosyltransferase involved in cell wall biosynthesis
MAIKKSPQIEISIIVPCFNEEKTIQLLLQAILNQNVEPEKMEVVISDAMSTDNTRSKIQEFALKNPRQNIRIVDNIKRTIPAAINLAASSAKGEYLLRLDAHSVPAGDYIQNSINLLKSGKAQNVGGIWEISPGSETCIAKAIARAVAHPLGAGDAGYRINAKSGYVDTVPFGSFKKSDFDQIGGFDEDLLSNEDYEFNTRLRQNGGKVWLDTSIRSKYYARKDLTELGKQYWRYGFWKNRMLRKYPSSLRWRQAIPPFFVLSLIILGILSFFIPIARIIFTTGVGVYLLTLFSSSIIESVKKKDGCYLMMAFAFATIHFCWGGGFLYSYISR